MTTAKFQAVLFDLDGTLVDTVDLIVKSYQHVWLTLLGRQLDDARARAFIGRTLRAAMLDEGVEDVEGMIAEYTSWNWAHLAELQRDYPGVPELLAGLRASGVTTGVVTAKRRRSAAMSLDAANLTDLVGLTVAMEDTAAHKPDPTPLLVAAQRLGIEPGTAAYVGDTIYDVQAAKAAGMAAIAVTWGAGEAEDLRLAQPDHLVSEASQLRRLLIAAP